ncbi:MAG: GFA family protein [Myxococcales bacterium]
MLTGQCHCGNIAVRFATRKDPRTLALRACGCTFCRRHGARTAADPEGRVEIAIGDAAQLSRYRWGLATADFLVCRRCGVYAAALLTEGAQSWATVNTRILDDQAPFQREAGPVDYEGESAEQRIARRKQQWTPASVSG